MPMPARTARERWSQFLSFVVMWVLAAVVGSALLFYSSGGSDSPPAVAEPGPSRIALENRAPEPPPAPIYVDAPEAPEPEPAVKHARENVRAEPTPLEPARAVADGEKASKLAPVMRRAAAATEAGDYVQATRAYESALELDPNNFEVKILIGQVASLRELEAREAGQRFQESSTELTTDGSPSESRTGELIIEILPSAPNPGDPYVLRVRAQNLSSQSLALASVELIDTHDSMNGERGRPVAPLAQHLGPKETALLWERQSDWTTADRNGTIVVVVTLADGSRLSKSIWW